eukprot:scaffold1309_cov21-Tisochrysis_lutea.AAC.1
MELANNAYVKVSRAASCFLSLIKAHHVGGVVCREVQGSRLFPLVLRADKMCHHMLESPKQGGARQPHVGGSCWLDCAPGNPVLVVQMEAGTSFLNTGKPPAGKFVRQSSKTSQAHTMYDSNSSGSLDANQVAALMEAMVPDVTPLDLAHVVAVLDMNGSVQWSASGLFMRQELFWGGISALYATTAVMLYT